MRAVLISLAILVASPCAAQSVMGQDVRVIHVKPRSSDVVDKIYRDAAKAQQDVQDKSELLETKARVKRMETELKDYNKRLMLQLKKRGK